MAFTSSGLITLITLVDRPNHNQVVSLAKRANMLPSIVRPFAAALLTYLLLVCFADLNGKEIPIAVTIGVVTFAVNFLDDAVMAWAERNSSRIAMVFAVVCLFACLAITLIGKKSPLIVIAAGAGGFCVAWIIVKVGLMLFSVVINLLSVLMNAFASPIAAPILFIVAYFNNRALRKKYKGWVTSRGTPIIEFSNSGVKYVHHENEAIFVSSSRLRAGGEALAAGIPLFTLGELSNSALVNQRTSAALQVLTADGAQKITSSFANSNYSDIENHPLMDFNPATGLPMFDGIGGMDVAGNVFGTDNNQPYTNMGMGHDSLDGH